MATVVDCEHRTAPVAPSPAEHGYSIRTTDLLAGAILIDRAKRVTEQTYLQFTRRATPTVGDLIFSREAPVGQVGLVVQDLPLCLGQRTVLLQPDRATIRPAFLKYLLLGLDAQRWMLKHSTGTTVLHLNVADVREIPLGALPTLEVQDSVVNELDALESVVTRLGLTLTHQADRTSSLRRTILASAFSGQLDSGPTAVESVHV